MLGSYTLQFFYTDLMRETGYVSEKWLIEEVPIWGFVYYGKVTTFYQSRVFLDMNLLSNSRKRFCCVIDLKATFAEWGSQMGGQTRCTKYAPFRQMHTYPIRSIHFAWTGSHSHLPGQKSWAECHCEGIFHNLIDLTSRFAETPTLIDYPLWLNVPPSTYKLKGKIEKDSSFKNNQQSRTQTWRNVSAWTHRIV